MRRLALALLALCGLISGAAAQTQFPTPQKQGQPATGVLDMCLSANGLAVPCALSDQPQPGIAAPFAAPSADQKALIVTPSPNLFGGTRVATQAAASNAVLKNGPGRLVNLTITIGATSGWLMLFDATSLPGNGSTGASLVYCLPVNSNGTTGGQTLSWGLTPLQFTTGITAGFSSTACNSLTASATAFFYAQVF